MGTEVQAKSTPTVAPAISHAPANLLQRKCACGGEHGVSGECEGCRNKRLGVVQRLAVNTSQVPSVPPIVHEVLRSPGQPLDMETRAFMEPRFGHDFSQVRIHTHGPAARICSICECISVHCWTTCCFWSKPIRARKHILAGN